MSYLTALRKRIQELETEINVFLTNLNRQKKATVFLFLLFFVLLLFFNRGAFMVADDYIYSFVFTTKDRIVAFGDVLESQRLHYSLWGGRLVAHTLLQTILMFSPLVIDIINSLVFVLFLLLLGFHIRGEVRIPNLSLILGVFFATWIFQPAFADTVLWITGAVNYLWGTFIILLFLLPYRLYSGEAKSKLYSFFIFILGLIAGCMNENTSLAMIVMAVLFLFSFKRSFKTIPLWAILGILGAFIGYIIMVVAPGNYARAEGVTNEPFVFIYRFLTHTQSFVYYLGGLNLLAFILGVLYIQYAKNRSHTFSLIAIYGVGVLASVYAMVLSPSFPPRAWFGPISFNIILLGILFVSLDNSIVLLRRIKLGMLFLGFVTFGFTLYDAVRDVAQIANIRESRGVEIEEAKKTGAPVVIKKNVNRTKFGLGDNPNAYVVDYMSAYYGVTIINPEEK